MNSDTEIRKTAVPGGEIPRGQPHEGNEAGEVGCIELVNDPDIILGNPRARRLFLAECNKYDCRKKLFEAVEFGLKLRASPLCLYRIACENSSFCEEFEDLQKEIKKIMEVVESEPESVVFTAAELGRLILAPTLWIVDQFITEGLTLLVGKPKIGKSWMVLHLCLTLARGGLLFGRYRTLRCQVLYVALEDTLQRLKSRMLHLSGSDRLPEDLLLMNSLPHTDNKRNLEFIREFADDNPRCRVVVIDTLAKIRPVERKSAGGIYQQDTEFLGPLQKWALSKNVAVILVHHDRKMPAKDVFETISGSNGLFGSADTTLVVTGERNSSERILHVTGRDIPERKIAMKFDNGIWEVVSEGMKSLISPERKILVDTIKKFGPMTPTQLSEKLGRKRAGVNKLLISLKGQGVLSQNSNKEYLAEEDRPEKGEAVVPCSNTAGETPALLDSSTGVAVAGDNE